MRILSICNDVLFIVTLAKLLYSSANVAHLPKAGHYLPLCINVFTNTRRSNIHTC